MIDPAMTASHRDAVSTVASRGLAGEYTAASPFPHVVVDNLFAQDHLDRLLLSYDAVEPDSWHVQDSSLQAKRRTRHDTALPAAAQAYFDYVNSGPFLRFLSSLTGIENLVPDPALHGGGMHEVGAGGRFEVHVDFERHPRTGLDNRLTVITYLNRDWTAEHGGSLELWQKTPRVCVEKILPTFGRTVIFEQSAIALHGHTDPVRRQPGRRALITYYYTNGRVPVSNVDTLSTTYYRRNGQSILQQAEIFVRRAFPPALISAAKLLVKKASKA